MAVVLPPAVSSYNSVLNSTDTGSTAIDEQTNAERTSRFALPVRVDPAEGVNFGGSVEGFDSSSAAAGQPPAPRPLVEAL